jgi:hypothetical protein
MALQSKPRKRDESPLHRIGRDILGPALCLHIHRLIRVVDEERMGRLFFLAREGHLLKRIYDKLVTLHRGPRPAYAYLHVSRRSTALPSVRTLGPREIDLALSGPHASGLWSVLRAFNLADREVLERIRDVGIEELAARVHDPAHDPAVARLLDDEGFQLLVRRRADEARDRLLRYLHQEGLFLERQVALVDIGWCGTIQDNLARATATVAAAPELRGLYFGLYCDERGRGARQAKRGLVYDWRHDRGLRGRAPLHFMQIFEEACRPAEGMTLDYVIEGDAVLPVCQSAGAEREAELRSHAAVVELQAGILAAADHHLDRFIDATGTLLDGLRTDVQRDLERLIFLPTSEELRALGELCSVEDWAGSGFARSCWKPGYLAATGGRPLCALFRQYERAKLAVARS